MVTRGAERVSLESDSPQSSHSKPFLVPDAVSDDLGSPGRGGGFSEREVHEEWAWGSWSRTSPEKQTRLWRTSHAHAMTMLFFQWYKTNYVLKLGNLSGLPNCEIPSLPKAELDSSLWWSYFLSTLRTGLVHLICIVGTRVFLPQPSK